MNCPKCGIPMIIDDWNAWKWTCRNCDYEDRTATSEEITDQHDWLNDQIKKQRP